MLVNRLIHKIISFARLKFDFRLSKVRIHVLISIRSRFKLAFLLLFCLIIMMLFFLGQYFGGTSRVVLFQLVVEGVTFFSLNGNLIALEGRLLFEFRIIYRLQLWQLLLL